MEERRPTLDYADRNERRPLVFILTPKGWLFWLPLALLILVGLAAVIYWIWPERQMDIFDKDFDKPRMIKVRPGR